MLYILEKLYSFSYFDKQNWNEAYYPIYFFHPYPIKLIQLLFLSYVQTLTTVMLIITIPR